MRRRALIPLASVLVALAFAAPLRAQDGARSADAVRRATLDSLLAVESRVRWETAPAESAIARATRAGRPAFLDFYADWCAPCRWMDRAVYPDPLLGEVAEAVAMIRIDIDRPAGRTVAQRFGVVQYPTLVYIAPDGREMLRWPGPLGLRDTRLNLGQAALPGSGRAAFEAARARGPRDLATQAHALEWYARRGEVERVRAIVDTLARGRAGADAALLQVQLAHAEEIAGRRERALAAYQKALALDADGPHAWRAWLGASVCLEAAGEGEAAEAAAREAQARQPAPWLAARVARLMLSRGGPALVNPPGVE